MTRFDAVPAPLHLPFVGRRAEVSAILAFWRAGFDAGELRAQLLVGEAGVGKSRLADVAIGRIVEAGGAVVHVRLYPDSSDSLQTLLHHALQMPGRGILPSVQSSLDGNSRILPALRRLVRLRATLLVLEDVHLLDESSAATLGSLLASLSGESLSLLCLARPGVLAARPAIERYVVSELALPGLDADECAELWRSIATPGDGRELSGELHRLTGGNPLAIRSAIWGAIARGAIARNGADTGWRCVDEPAVVGSMLERSVDLLTDGMTLALPPEQLEAARSLALLGEVFAADAARLLVDDADEHIASLVAAAVLVPSPHVAVPLVGPPTADRYAFAHSLVHARLVRTASIDAARLVTTLAAAPPIFSTLPFTAVAAHVSCTPLQPEAIAAMLDVGLRACVELNNRKESSAAAGLWRAARAIHDRFGESMTAPSREGLEATLLWTHLLVVLRGRTAEQSADAAELLRRTENPTSAAMAGARMRALARLAYIDVPRLVEYRDEIDALLETFPELIASGPHVYSIKELAHACGGQTVAAHYHDLERRISQMLAHEGLGVVAREELLAAAGMLLFIISTPEDLERRLELLRTIQAGSPDLVARTAPPHACMRIEIGELETAAALARAAVARARRAGDARHYQMEYYLSYIRAIHVDVDRVLPEAKALDATLVDPFWRESMGHQVGMYLCQILLLRGETTLAWKAVEDFAYDLREQPPDRWVLFRHEGCDVPARDMLNWEGDAHRRILDRLDRYAFDPSTADPHWLAGELESYFGVERMHIWDRLLMVHAVDTLIDEAKGRDGGALAKAAEAAMRAEATKQLEWLLDEHRRIASFADALVTRFERILGRSVVARWRQRIAKARREVTYIDEPHQHGGTIAVGMLGTMTVRDGAAPSERIQGARVRLLLATIVAGELLERPLTQAELYRVAVGDDVERENARNIVKTTVRRVRDVVGDDGILTDGETPTLNRARVRVDLLDAVADLDTSREALGRGHLVRAVAHLHAALDALDGEVPFPGCYGEFFEALRDDLDVRIRAALLDAARALGREGDSIGAAALLEKGARVLPGDEEVSDLRARFLAASGRQSEARRVLVEEEEEEA